MTTKPDGSMLGKIDYQNINYPAYEAQASSDTLTAADYGRTIYCLGLSGDITLTLPSASTVGNGWWIRIVRGPNSSGTDVTVSRAGTDTITFDSDAGLTSLLLPGDGDYIDIVSTGSAWVACGQITVSMNVYPDFPLGATGQTISTGTVTVVQYDTVNRDTHGGFATGTYEYTVPLSGMYYVTAGAVFETGSSVDYFAEVQVDLDGAGTTLNFGGTVPPDSAYNSFQTIQCSGLWAYDKDDVLSVEVQHTHGSDRQINDSDFVGEGANMTIWQMHRLGPRW